MEINLNEDYIKLSFYDEDGEKNKKFNLPAKINPEYIKKSYKNGIIDITLKKKNIKVMDKGYKVKID